jgi:hypothetical protein
MNNYPCPTCKKEFKKKCHLDDHLNKKKKPCININVNTETNPIMYSLVVPPNPLKNPPNPLKNPPSLPDTNIIKKLEVMKNNDDNKYKCRYCNLVCTRSDSLNRHIDKNCKNKKHIENIEELQSQINTTSYISVDEYGKMEKDNLKLQEDNKKLMNILEEYKHFIKDNNLVKQSIPSTNTANNAINNINNTNNGAIINGNINNTTINNIVQFGKEDLSKCDLIEMMNIYLQSTGGNIFPNIIKYLNFNPKFPQNFNISMGDLARENVKVYDGKKFITKKFINVKGDILNSVGSHITTMCDSYMKNPKTKKSNDILGKIKINDISVKLITNDDITPLLTIKKEKKNKILKIAKNKADDEDTDSDDSSDEYLDYEGEKKLAYYENKREGLQEITDLKLKEELYNNRALVHGSTTTHF